MALKIYNDDLAMEQYSERAPDNLEAMFQRDIRPVLDVVDKIRAQGVTEENIQLPTIVVVGDQSSGKSSVLESLAGITLPRGQGIATRVPLVLRLQSCKREEESIIKMDYGSVKEKKIIGEEAIEAAINEATNVLAGNSKGVKDSPIQLYIRKPNAPDLTMVDLPGITRVPVHGQPQDIYEQISAMIMQYITPEESIILNVLSAQVDFPTCESIRMSQQVDKEGKRTLAVVTKVDKSPEGLLEKVTTDAVNIGLGYICVRNRIDADDSIAIARLRERELFRSHPALKDLDKSMVGIPALASKLTKIQSDMVKGCLPRIQKQLNEAFHRRNQQIANLPKGIKSDADARSTFFLVQNNILATLTQIVRDGNFEKFPDDATLHYTARLHEMFLKFADDLHEAGSSLKDQSQTKEIQELLKEHQGVGLPDFLPHTVLHSLMKKQIESVSQTCTFLVDNAFEYATNVVLDINHHYSQGYPPLEKCYTQLAIATLDDLKKTTVVFVERMLEKEKTIVFTTNDYYITTLEKMHTALSSNRNSYHLKEVDFGARDDKIVLSELVSNFDRNYQDAWKMKVSVAAYWKVVQKRLADEIPLEIRYALQVAIIDEIHQNMMSKPWSGAETDLRALMEEDSTGAYNRSRLQLRVDNLKECLRHLNGVMR